MNAGIIYRGSSVPSSFKPPLFSQTHLNFPGGSLSYEAMQCYGSDAPFFHRLADELNRSHERQSAFWRDGGISSLDFHVSRRGDITAYYTFNGTVSARNLSFFAPYFQLAPDELYTLFRSSFLRKSNGACSFSFEAKEQEYLNRALSALVDKKIEDAKERGDGHISFCLKVIGLGDEGREFIQLSRMILREVQQRAEYKGFVFLQCVGFDVSSVRLTLMEEEIISLLRNTIRVSRIKDRVSVSYNAFYGDVLAECSAPYMIAFPADVSLLRNTHAFRFGEAVTNAYAQRFFTGLQLCLAPLGIMIVNEDGKDGRRFELQCVNT